jgi:hypothetical protein
MNLLFNPKIAQPAGIGRICAVPPQSKLVPPTGFEPVFSP